MPELDAQGRTFRNSALGCAIVGLVLIPLVLRLREFVAWREVPGEKPEMAWVAMIFPGFFFLIAFVNWRAYRRHMDHAQRKQMQNLK